MAGALGLSLAGPRRYAGELVDDAWMGAGRTAALTADVNRALRVFIIACTLVAILLGSTLLIAAKAGFEGDAALSTTPGSVRHAQRRLPKRLTAARLQDRAGWRGGCDRVRKESSTVLFDVFSASAGKPGIVVAAGKKSPAPRSSCPPLEPFEKRDLSDRARARASIASIVARSPPNSAKQGKNRTQECPPI
jgi:hypothetical protein